MINYLVSSRSVGIDQYTASLAKIVSIDREVHIERVSGSLTVSQMNGVMLGEYLMNQLSGLSGVLHVHLDSQLFRGNGDDWDELETVEYFLRHAHEQFKMVCITHHGITSTVYGTHWSERAAQFIITRRWRKHVLPLIDKCVNIVHSTPQVNSLNSKGINNIHQIPALSIDDCVSKEFEPITSPVKILVPGRVKGYIDYDFIIKTMSHVDCDYQLTVPADYSHQFVPIEQLCREYNIPGANDIITGKPPLKNHAEYMSNLKLHDIAMIAYTHDIPHSGCIQDCVDVGMYTFVKDSPSVSQKHNGKYKIMSHAQSAGAYIDKFVGSIDSQKSLYSNMESYRRKHNTYVMRLLNSIYDATPEIKQSYKQDIYIKSSTISRDIQRQYVTRRDIPFIIESIYSRVDDIDIPDMEHYFTHVNEVISDPWVGVMHGPSREKHEHYSSDVRSFEYLLDNSNLKKSLKTCKKIYVVNQLHQQYLESQTYTPVELIDIIETSDSPIIEYDSSNKKPAVLSYYGADFSNIDLDTVELFADRLPHVMGECLPRLEHVEQLTRDMFDTHKVIINQTMDVMDDILLQCIHHNTPYTINKTPTVGNLITRGIIHEENTY